MPPPKSRLAFRVGVVGHRPDRLPDDAEPVRRSVREILEAIKRGVESFHGDDDTFYDPAEPVLRVISPLAEGSDRLVAREAMALGYELQCPIPFELAEYEKDFLPPRALVPDSLAEFRSLLEQGRRTGTLVLFEGDGQRDEQDVAYGATGRVVLNQSDVVIVIWDGKSAQGRGGTVDTIRQAVDFRIPVFWIDALEGSRWCLVRDKETLPAVAGTGHALPAPMDRQSASVPALVDEILRPPENDREAELREAFFTERKPRWNPAFLWKTFRDLVARGRLTVRSPRVPDFEEAVRREWPSDGEGVTSWVNAALRAHYAWPDRLADFYADRYRSVFVFAFLAAVLAVMLALAPLAEIWHVGDEAERHHHRDLLAALCAVGELLVILVILVTIAVSWWRRWHERWLDYRLVAELARQLRLLLPLGGGRPFPRIPAHLATYGDPERTWMYWHVRAIERSIGLPGVTVDAAFLEETVRNVLEVVRGQIRFHDVNHRRSERIERNLHVTGVTTFVATLVLCAVHSLHYAWIVGVDHVPVAEAVPGPLLGVLCAVLPALGAALAGINNQGEFGRVAKRSRGMEQRLRKLEQRGQALLAHGTRGGLRSARAIALASEVGQLLVDEVLGWRVVFQDRPSVLPT